MNTAIMQLKEALGKKARRRLMWLADRKLARFEQEHGLLLPEDLKDYYRMTRNPDRDLDKGMYTFYPLYHFESVNKALGNWGGVPDYRNIVHTLNASAHCFVFADYMSHLFAYAIRLYPDNTTINEVYLICGDQYKQVAHSFSGFIELYLNDSPELTNI
ncbi:MAG: SMI1/KNR4 family protein [Chitinophagaceae bacterium]